ncbi:MAG: YfjI family protein [Isosphaeraceae bacterium]
MSTTTQANTFPASNRRLAEQRPPKIPNFEPRAELAVVGAILADPRLLDRIGVAPSDFYDGRCRDVVSAALAFPRDTDVGVFSASIEDALVGRSAMTSAEFVEFAAEAAQHASLEALERNASLVRQLAEKRRNLASIEELAAAVRQGRKPDESAVGAVASMFSPKPTPAPDFDGPPRPIATVLRPVPRFDPDLMPGLLRDWVADIAERMGCAAEFVAVAAMFALSVVLGRKVAIRPKREDDWAVVANLWGMAVGRPGILKSPALAEAMKPVQRLIALARERHQAAKVEHEAAKLSADVRRDLAKQELKDKAKAGKVPAADLDDLARQAVTIEEGPPPTERRYLTSDTSVAKLGELLEANPNGLGIFRDELMGFLKSLEMQGHEADRAFFLEGWCGTGGFSVDRIGRGSIHIPSVCLSLFGGIQPGPLAAYIRAATAGAGEDGFAARFQLAVYPDQDRPFQIVDRKPDARARDAAFALFEEIDQLDPADIGAVADETDAIPYLRFTPDAQAFFYQWWTELENTKVRNPAEPPDIVNHLSKYRSLMPALALLFHLADRGAGPVGLDSARLAAAWCELLEEHARRIYDAARDGDAQPARDLAKRLRDPAKSKLPVPFTARDIYRKGWTGLATEAEADRALAILEDHGYIKALPSNPGPGRPSVSYIINPDHLAGGSV